MKQQPGNNDPSPTLIMINFTPNFITRKKIERKRKNRRNI